MSVELALALISTALCIGSSIGVLVAGVILLFLDGHPLRILCVQQTQALVTEARLQPPGGRQSSLDSPLAKFRSKEYATSSISVLRFTPFSWSLSSRSLM